MGDGVMAAHASIVTWCLVAGVALVSPASAQRRDADGGTIGKGKPARCLIDDPTRERCTFYPRNGDGSFAISTSLGRYYATRLGPNVMQFDYDNGARMVDQGRFVRSKDDPACWVQRPDRRICAW